MRFVKFLSICVAASALGGYAVRADEKSPQERSILDSSFFGHCAFVSVDI